MLQLSIKDPLLLPANKILLTVPHCNKIDPLKKFLLLAACVLFRNKISLKEYQMQLAKSLCNNGATYHLARIAPSDPSQKNKLRNYKTSSSGANHSHLEFQYQYERSPFKKSCLMRPECQTKLLSVSNFWIPNSVVSKNF